MLPRNSLICTDCLMLALKCSKNLEYDGNQQNIMHDKVYIYLKECLEFKTIEPIMSNFMCNNNSLTKDKTHILIRYVNVIRF